MRILYPEPPVCLHLPAWQEFYGFDRQGREAWFDIAVDTKALTLQFLPAREKLPGFADTIGRRNFAYHVEELSGQDREALALTAAVDGIVLWEEGTEAQAFTEGRVYGIDPRKGK